MKTIKPYSGSNPYAFLSYSHKDEGRIEKLIFKLQQAGCNIWYDEGIAPSSEWGDSIARMIKNASIFFVIMSKNSIASQNVRREIYYAVSKDIPILTYYLDIDLLLPEGIDMQLGISQAVKSNDENYFDKLLAAFPACVISENAEIICSTPNFAYFFQENDHEFLIFKMNRENYEKEVLYHHETSRAFTEYYYIHSKKYSQKDEFHSLQNDVMFFSVLEDLESDIGVTAPDIYVDYSFAIEKPNSPDSVLHLLQIRKKRKEEPFDENACLVDLDHLPYALQNKVTT